jgi:O-antigen ligase
LGLAAFRPAIPPPKPLSVLAEVFVLIAGPALAFPSLVPARIRLAVVLPCMAVSLTLAVALLFRWKPVGILVGLFALTVGATLWHTPLSDSFGLSHLVGLALGLLVMSTLANWCETSDRLALAAAVFALTGAGVLVVGLAGTGTDSTKVVIPALANRLHLGLLGLGARDFVNPNGVGGTAVLIAPVAVALLFVPPTALMRRLRAVGAASAAIMIAVLLVSGSRTAWLAAGLTLVVLLLWIARNKSSGPMRVAVLAAATAPVLTALAFRWVVGEQRFDLLTQSAQESFAVRLAVWHRAAHALSGSPWSGIGVNQFRHVTVVVDLSTFFRSFETAHAHNIALQVALDLGLIGLAAYAALVILLLILADRAARGPNREVSPIAAGAGLSLVGVHLFGLGDAIALGAKVGVFQWAASGLILAAWRLHAGLARPEDADLVRSDRATSNSPTLRLPAASHRDSPIGPTTA